MSSVTICKVVLMMHIAVNIDDGSAHVRKAVQTPKPTPVRVGDADRPKTLQGNEALLWFLLMLFWHLLHAKDFSHLSKLILCSVLAVTLRPHLGKEIQFSAINFARLLYLTAVHCVHEVLLIFVNNFYQMLTNFEHSVIDILNSEFIVKAITKHPTTPHIYCYMQWSGLS